jgi:hypothetical protein
VKNAAPRPGYEGNSRLPHPRRLPRRVLDPGVVFPADPVAVRMGGQAEIRGAAAVAETFKGRAQAAKPALIGGAVGLAVIMGGQLRIALNLTIANDRIVAIEAVADPERLSQFDLVILNA